MSAPDSHGLTDTVVGALRGVDESSGWVGRLTARDDSVLDALAALPSEPRATILARASRRPLTWEQRLRRRHLGRPSVAAVRRAEMWTGGATGRESRDTARWAGLPWTFGAESLLERLDELGSLPTPLTAGDVARLIDSATPEERATIVVLWAESGADDEAAVPLIEQIEPPASLIVARGALIARGSRVPSATLERWATHAETYRGPLGAAAKGRRFAVLAAASHPAADPAFERCLRVALTAPPADQTRLVDVLASTAASLRLSVPFERLARSLVLRPSSDELQLARLHAMTRALARFGGGAAEATYAALRQTLSHVRHRAGHALVHASGLLALSQTPGRALDVVWAALHAELSRLQPSAVWAPTLELIAEASPSQAIELLKGRPDYRGWLALVMAPWAAAPWTPS